MKNNPYNQQNDPTQPIQPPPNPQQNDKLILGNFRDPQKRPERKPYQYPNPQQPAYPQQTAQPQGYQQRPPSRQEVPAAGRSYSISPPPPQYPYSSRGQRPGGPAPSRPRPRRRRGCLITTLIVLLLLIILGALTINTAQKVLAFGSAISTQAPLTTQTGYMGTGDRVNLLVMGFGGAGHGGAYLTDSMVVMSLLPQSHHTTLVSVPRDLWVQIPPNSGQYNKLNYAYVYGSNNGVNRAGGGDLAAQKISDVTGLDVKYWITINFAGFRDFINSIGGIDVYVPDSFNACYPKNDNADIDPNWIKVQFSKGMQHMNGERAIEYARAREPLEVCRPDKSSNPAELTDFARSARQQIIIKAALSKVKQISTWPSLYKALDALQHAIYTNLSLADLSEFALKMDLSGAHHVGLSNQNVLRDVTLSDGTYTLQAANGNWQAVKNYVQQQLYN